MCGIFGLIIRPCTELSIKDISKTFEKLALLSESRGKDSSGISIRSSQKNTINVIKGDIPVSELIRRKKFKQILQESLEEYSRKHGFTAFGHARLVTNGSQLNDENNQPVVKNGIIVIHNGIIVNAEDLWEMYPRLNREYTIDTEIIPAILREELEKDSNLSNAVSHCLRKLDGTFSVAAMFENMKQFILATNNGSLYYLNDKKSFFVFASERYFLQTLKNETCFRVFGLNCTIEQLCSNQGIIIDMDNLEIQQFDITKDENPILVKQTITYTINKFFLKNEKIKRELIFDPSVFVKHTINNDLFKSLENNILSIQKLKRCTKCILPETFPFIDFDDSGVCNYCRNHIKSNKTKTIEELKSLVEPYRSKEGKPDCIVPFSGGRDSTYSLHVIKRELNLNPIAFTYDWGMVTDLARRNIARVCGKLGVENIIVSADIHWKRGNIRKNIEAWLKNPVLGMIPLFMAGDKFFFYYTNKIKKQTGINLNIWGINKLENTEFKVGFAGIAPNFEKSRIYSLSVYDQIKLFGFVGQNVLKSPGYINQSVLDTIGSFASRYISPKKDYYHLFDYYRWDEDEINDLIKEEYKWETAIDTSSTWRIGDGTASFYNYIYYTVAGFSEHDTFRSNQIREGMISREKGIELILTDNQPRYETLRWYLEIINLDFKRVIERINQIEKMYPVII